MLRNRQRSARDHRPSGRSAATSPAKPAALNAMPAKAVK